MKDKRDMRRVWKDYTDELVDEYVADHIDSAADCSNRAPDERQACQMMAQQMHSNYGKWKKERALTDARKWRSEDGASGGLTYAWRVAEHDEDAAFAMSVGETAAGAVATGTGWGTALYAGYMGVKEGYANQRAANNEDKNAALAAGLANGVLTGVMKHYKVDKFLDVDLTFDPEEGFGTTVGISGPLGENSPIKAGIELSFSEKKQSFTGGKATLGVDLGKFEGLDALDGFNLDTGINFNEKGGFDGATIGGGWESDNEALDLGLDFNIDANGYYAGSSVNASYKSGKNGQHDVNGSMSFDADGQFTTGEIGYSHTSENRGTGDKAGLNTSHTAGGGLTFNADGSYGLYVSNSATYNNIRNRINQAKGSTKNTMMYDANGEFTGSTSETSASFEFQTNTTREREINEQWEALYESMTPTELAILAEVQGQVDMFADGESALDAHANLQDRLDKRLAELQKAGIISADSAANIRSFAEFDEMRDTITFEGGLERNLQRMMQENRITQEQALAIMEDPSKLHELDLDLGGYEHVDKSRISLGDKIAGAISDAWSWIKGDVSNSNGYINPETGEFVVRTCFTAGTLVKTAKGHKPIEEVKVGDLVSSWNESTGQVEMNRVVRTFVRETKEIYQITYTNGQVVETTATHPFYIEGKGWTQAKDLVVNDENHTAGSILSDVPGLSTGQVASISMTRIRPVQSQHLQRIAKIDVVKSKETVYNFEVENAHTYFVSEANLLVHNECFRVPDTKQKAILTKYQKLFSHLDSSGYTSSSTRKAEFNSFLFGLTPGLAALAYAEDKYHEVKGTKFLESEQDTIEKLEKYLKSQNASDAEIEVFINEFKRRRRLYRLGVPPSDFDFYNVEINGLGKRHMSIKDVRTGEYVVSWAVEEGKIGDGIESAPMPIVDLGVARVGVTAIIKILGSESAKRVISQGSRMILTKMGQSQGTLEAKRSVGGYLALVERGDTKLAKNMMMELSKTPGGRKHIMDMNKIADDLQKGGRFNRKQLNALKSIKQDARLLGSAESAKSVRQARISQNNARNQREASGAPQRQAAARLRKQQKARQKEQKDEYLGRNQPRPEKPKSPEEIRQELRDSVAKAKKELRNAKRSGQPQWKIDELEDKLESLTCPSCMRLAPTKLK
ncbi:MAG: polymorphic toxin-type HINT domain-containing protein [Spirochaetota bacterium]